MSLLAFTPRRPGAAPAGRGPAALLGAVALAAACLASCSPAGNPAGTAGADLASGAASGAAVAGPGAASAPPVGVTTVRALQRDMQVLITATGTVAPLSSVDVRPQTTSLVAQVHVKEGQFVKAGQLLFTLDPRADEANMARARAQLARDEAALADAQRQLQRSRELLAQGFISQGALDTSQTNAQSLAAALAADKAAMDTARLGLSYTRISAPGAGRLGAINVFPGSSVQANQTLLVSITQLDPIAVSFSLPQRYLADALSALKDGGAAVSATTPDNGAKAASGSGSGNTSGNTTGALTGRLKFVDNAVDASTGTVKVKAEFANKDNRLWPGAFVDVGLTARTLVGAVVVPQAAIIESARGPLVYAVVDGKAVARPVELLYAQGEDAAVSGVKPGDRVVLDGRQNLRPGAAVVERPREGGGGRAGKGAGAGAPGASSASSASAAVGTPGATGPAARTGKELQP